MISFLCEPSTVLKILLERTSRGCLPDRTIRLPTKYATPNVSTRLLFRLLIPPALPYDWGQQPRDAKLVIHRPISTKGRPIKEVIAEARRAVGDALEDWQRPIEVNAPSPPPSIWFVRRRSSWLPMAGVGVKIQQMRRYDHGGEIVCLYGRKSGIEIYIGRVCYCLRKALLNPVWKINAPCRYRGTKKY